MNQVDSERIMSALVARGYEIVPEEEAEVIVVNTCGFIEAAREESIETILTVAGYRKTGKLKALVVAGCLAQHYQEELARDLTEADAVIGLADAASIPDVCDSLLGRDSIKDREPSRVLIGLPYTAYLKIAEGCNNRCSYCAIPMIRGRFRSMPEYAILEEASELAAYGVRELVLVGQDTTNYSHDGKTRSLARLLEKLDAIPDIAWIRLMYAHPAALDDSLVEAMASLKKVVPYLDMPIQHISANVLKRMGRPSNSSEIRAVIERLRSRIPGLVLRTTLMTGFPGETESDFKKLADFVREARFERLGVFTYSPEEGTRALRLIHTVPEEIAAERAEELMSLQLEQVNLFQQSLVGREFDMIVDSADPETGSAQGRTYHDAPEIDGSVTVDSGVEMDQPFIRIRITAAHGYALDGEVAPWREA
jgi:ribosomal protein S12 methylthiotransferase